MAKIIVCEDGYNDLLERYKRLGPAGHDVYAYLYDRFNGVFFEDPQTHTVSLTEKFAKFYESAQFKEVRPYADFRDALRVGNIPAADWYCLDGLNGDCLQLAEKLPQEKVLLVSGDPDIRRKGKKKGLLTSEPDCLDLKIFVRRDAGKPN